MKIRNDALIERMVLRDSDALALDFLHLLDVEGIGPTLVASDGRAIGFLPVFGAELDARGPVAPDALALAREAAERADLDVMDISPAELVVHEDGVEVPGVPGSPRFGHPDKRVPDFVATLKEAQARDHFDVILNPWFLYRLAQAIGSPESVRLRFGADRGASILVEARGVMGELGAVGVLMPIDDGNDPEPVGAGS